jgi:hypothetical protein
LAEKLNLAYITPGYDIDIAQGLLKLQHDLKEDPRNARQKSHQLVKLFTEENNELERA